MRNFSFYFFKADRAKTLICLIIDVNLAKPLNHFHTHS